jgi:hypothetical protein
VKWLAIAAAVSAAVLVAAGCGGGGGGRHHTTTERLSEPARPPCRHRGPLTPKQRIWYRRAVATLAAMRKAHTHARASTLTDRFLNDLGRGNLPIYIANRLIDHAVAAVTAICQDCFQALEASRPIVEPQRCT